MRSVRTVSLFFGVVVTCIFALWFTANSSATQKKYVNAYTDDETYWIDRIQKEGGFAGYAEFASSVADLSPKDQHQKVHYFGGALYEAEGISAAGVCDAQFSYGCFHEFLGRAILAEGLSSMQVLDDACFAGGVPHSLSCQHGIGHGVLAYIGYEKKDLDHALDECSRLSHMDSIGGCYGGVFMEFNFRTMLADETVRVVEHGNLRFPCDDLKSDYLNACAFWQPDWWRFLYQQAGDSKEKIFSKMGLLCDTLESSAQPSCYQGIGNITARESNFDARAGAKLCDLTSTQGEYRLLCRSFLADSLNTGGAGKKGEAAAACEDLPDTMRRACMKYVTE